MYIKKKKKNNFDEVAKETNTTHNSKYSYIPAEY